MKSDPVVFIASTYTLVFVSILVLRLVIQARLKSARRALEAME